MLLNCDGTHVVAQVVGPLQAHYPMVAAGTSVRQCLQTAMENGWVSLGQ